MRKIVQKVVSSIRNSRMLHGDKVNNFKLSDIGIKGKVFCISMQRSGTSSVGDFLEQWGLNRAGHQLSRKQQWSRHWYNGNFDAIFSDPAFQENEIFEDDPFWFPEFYKYVYHRIPDSRFVLLHRDADGWFKSMISHSNGFTIGRSDIHAKVYRREDDLLWLEKNVPDFKLDAPRAMTLFDKSTHYKAVYERYNEEVRRFFSITKPAALFHSELSDPSNWLRMMEWLNLPKVDGIAMHSHTHKAKRKFTRDNLLQTKVKPVVKPDI